MVETSRSLQRHYPSTSRCGSSTCRSPGRFVVTRCLHCYQFTDTTRCTLYYTYVMLRAVKIVWFGTICKDAAGAPTSILELYSVVARHPKQRHSAIDSVQPVRSGGREEHRALVGLTLSKLHAEVHDDDWPLPTMLTPLPPPHHLLSTMLLDATAYQHSWPAISSRCYHEYHFRHH